MKDSNENKIKKFSPCPIVDNCLLMACKDRAHCPHLKNSEGIMKKINWAKFTGAEDTCYCRCGKIFRSHAKYVMSAARMVTRKKCPSCGKNNNCWHVVSDPETIKI